MLTLLCNLVLIGLSSINFDLIFNKDVMKMLYDVFHDENVLLDIYLGFF